MATTTITTQATEQKLSTSGSAAQPNPAGPNRLFNDPEAKFGDFRDDLMRDGFCVVKGAVPQQRALQYAEDMYNYVETFKGGLGFKRDDPATFVEKHMPVINEKGMCLG